MNAKGSANVESEGELMLPLLGIMVWRVKRTLKDFGDFLKLFRPLNNL